MQRLAKVARGKQVFKLTNRIKRWFCTARSDGLAGLAYALIWLAVPFHALHVGAEEADGVLTVPFRPIAQFYVVEPNGELTGFAAELGRRIAAMAGFDIAFEMVSADRDFLATVHDPATGMTIGTPRLPELERTQLISDPITTSRTMLFVRASRAAELSEQVKTLSDLDIGVFAGVVMASNISGDLWDRNRRIPFDGVDALIIGLMDGSVDAIILEEGILLGRARRLGLEAQIYSAGNPLRDTTRHVVLSTEHRALLGPVNDAIAALEASGELGALRQAWNLQVIATEAPPDRLTYGVGPIPPLQIIREDGTIIGFSVEVMRELAKRAGLEVAFKAIPLPQYGAGPLPGQFDMTILDVTQARQQGFDHTMPVGRIRFDGYALADQTEIIATRPLSSLRIGVTRGSPAERALGARADLHLRLFDTVEGPLEALLAGDIDIAAYPSFLLDEVVSKRRGAAKVAIAIRNLAGADRVIVLRQGLASVRESLNGVIPGLLLSEEYRALERQFFQKAPFWTPERRRLAMGAAAAASMLALAGYAGRMSYGRRRWKRQAEQTRLFARRFEAVLSTTRSGILGIADDGRIALANPSARRMLCLDDAVLPVPRPQALIFLDPDTLRPAAPERDPLGRAGAARRIDNEIWALATPGDCRPGYVIINTATIPKEIRGIDFSTVVVLDDITEQQRARQDADRANRLDALGQLTGGIAHDFNNLLTTIRCSVSLARESRDATETAQLLDAIDTAVDTGADTTSRLLAFANPLPGANQTVSACAIVKDLELMARPVIESSIMLSFTCTEPGLMVSCDTGQLKNALLNLILNSRDAILGSGEGRRIAVSASRTDPVPHAIGGDAGGVSHAVLFEVRDDGPGMTEEVRRRATDPFFTTKRQKRNSGLGLPMVFGFVKQAHGTLAIDSEPGAGTRIGIVLPAAMVETPLAAPEPPADMAPRPVPASHEGRAPVVLVAEDRQELLDMVGRMLRMLGYAPHLTLSGDQALAAIEQGAHVDLLLTDTEMPGTLNGFQLARRARQILPDLPVLYMTGYTELGPEDMGDVIGPLLKKPFHAEALRRELRNALAASERGPGPQGRAGSVRRRSVPPIKQVR